MKLITIPIGFILIMVSPFILWTAESQQRAKDFSSAKEVAANSDERGYIIVKDNATATETIPCPANSPDKGKECLYVSVRDSEYVAKNRETCSATRPTGKIIQELDKQQCDENGQDCKKCYIVEDKNWETLSTDSQYTSFKVGEYTVLFDSNAKVFGAKEFKEYFSIADSTGLPESYPRSTAANPAVGDKEKVFTYITVDTEILVAGDAKDRELSKGDKVFVVSTLSYNQTLSRLEAQDSTAKWGLRIASLIITVIGTIMIFTGIASVPGFLAGFIPALGGKISKGLNSVATILGAVVGVVLWVIFFVVVMILKNIFLILIVLTGLGVAIAAGIYIIRQRKVQAPAA